MRGKKYGYILRRCWECNHTSHPSLLTSHLSLKQREVHAAVAAVFHEVGVSREIVVVAMLEHEDATGGQQILS